MKKNHWIALVFFAFLLMVFAFRTGLIHFLPSAEWQAALIWPARFAAGLGAVFGVVAGFAAKTDPKHQTNAKAAGKAVFFAVIGAILGYFLLASALPMLVTLVSGWPVVQEVTVATNVYGSSLDGRSCRGGLYVNDGRSFDPSLARMICLDTSGAKHGLMERQTSRGETEAVVTLHGWGNSVGVIYWSVDVPKG